MNCSRNIAVACLAQPHRTVWNYLSPSTQSVVSSLLAQHLSTNHLVTRRYKSTFIYEIVVWNKTAIVGMENGLSWWVPCRLSGFRGWVIVVEREWFSSQGQGIAGKEWVSCFTERGGEGSLREGKWNLEEGEWNFYRRMRRRVFYHATIKRNEIGWNMFWFHAAIAAIGNAGNRTVRNRDRDRNLEPDHPPCHRLKMNNT